MSNRGDRNGARKINKVVRPSTRLARRAKRNLLSGFETVLQDVRARLSALIPAAPLITPRPAFEMLEARQLLAANPLVNPGDYVIYDSANADPNDVDIIALATGTTGLGPTGISINTSTSDPDLIDLVINDPNPAAADNLIVNLVASGPINSITYNGSAGDTLVLNVIVDSITYTNATTLVAGPTATGLGFTIPAATDQTNPADLQGAIANGDVLTADGNIGNINIDVDTTIRGGIINNTAGNIGAINFAGNLDTSNAASTIVFVTPGANNTVTSFTVGGTTTVGNNDVTLILGTGGTAGGSATFTGAVSLGGTADLTITSDANSNLGTISFGSTVTLSGAGDSDLLIYPGAGGNFAGNVSFAGLITLQDAGDHDVFIGNGISTFGTLSFNGINAVASNAGSDVVISGGAITNLALGSATYTVNNAGSIAFSFGGNVGGISGAADLTIAANSNQANPISFATTGNTGAVTLGTLSNSGPSDIVFTFGDDAADTLASLTIGSVVANNVGVNNQGDFQFNAAGNITGAITITGAVSLGDAGEADGAFLNITAADAGDFVAGGVWTIHGAGSGFSLALTDVASTLGNIGSNTWDINFGNGAGTLAFSAADGIGTFTARTVDFLGATGGGFLINANSDGNDNVGPIGAISVLNSGDDNTNQTVFRGTVNATQGSSVTLAGGAEGTFSALTPAGSYTANSGGTGTWGAFTLGAGGVDDSVSDGLTIYADDGIASITVLGLRSTLVNSTINANVDSAAENGAANVIGALGNVNVTGQGGVDSLTGAWQAADFGDVTLGNGFMNLDITSNVTVLADRAAVTSNLGNVTVTTNGAITGGTWTLDDGVGNVSVTSIVPVNGTINLTAIFTDADNVPGAPASALGGTLGTLTATGGINIGTIDTDGTAAPAIGPAQASQNAGGIQAGASINIGTLDIGGSLPFIRIVEPISNLGANTINITTVAINGNLPLITSAGGAGDDVTIGGGTVNGDIDLISAGTADVSIGGLNVVGGTRTSPVFVVTDNAVDYILDIRGTWGTGTNAPTINYTLVFAGGDNNSITINDIEGTTDLTTKLTIATRANPTGTPQNYAGGLGGDTSNANFNLTGFFDDFGPGQDGRHDFDQILIEGDLLGDIGALANIAEASAGTAAILANPANFFLGHIKNLEVTGTFFNNLASIFARQLDEFSFGAIAVPDPNSPTGYSFDTPTQGGGTGVPVTGGNANGTFEDVEVFTALAGITGVNVVIPIPDGGSITKSFVGPTGALEIIRLTDTDLDGIVNTVVLNFTGGVITSIHLFGENIGIEYNALDPLNPATTSNTTVTYGQTFAGVAATTFVGRTLPGPDTGSGNVIDFLDFSSPIGNVTVIDTNTSDQFATNVGPIVVGYEVLLDSQSDLVNSLGSYINNPNQTGTGQTLRTSLASGQAGNVPVYAGIGNISVNGSLGAVVSSGGVGSITTTDTVTEATPVPSAHFEGLVTDGSAGAIRIEGNVAHSLVVGDAVVTALGADNALGGADDTIGINGTPAFGGNIAVQGNLGTTASAVGTAVDPGTAGGPTGLVYQLPVEWADNGETVATGSTILQTGPTRGYAGQQVSAPDGIDVNISAGGNIFTAIVSGKRILVDQTQDQNNDDISGNIMAGIWDGTQTGGNIHGDIWSGDDIGNDAGTTVIRAYGARVNGVYVGGNIASTAQNPGLGIYATGASAGNITSDIIAAAGMVDIQITAGSGSGGSLLANVIAGADGQGGVSANLSSSFIDADNDIGQGNLHIVSSADSQTWARIRAGLQIDGVAFGGNINSDFLAGTVAGRPMGIDSNGNVVGGNVNSSNLPIFDVDDDGIFITLMQAGWVDGADEDGIVSNDMNSHLNGTLVAAGDITIGNLQIDGNAIGNDGVPGGHIAAAGMGSKHTTNDLNISSGYVVVDVLGTFSAGMFVPFDNSGNNPLNANDRGPLQVGTVLSAGSANITLEMGRWMQSATGVNGADGINLAELVAGTESGANTSFAPTFSIGATNNVTANINVVGRPYAAPQTGPGNVSPDPADGDAMDVSIAAFGNVSGNIVVEDTGDFNFGMSNIDAVTAIGGGGADPSSPSTGLGLNDGTSGDLNVNITSNGSGQGGLRVDYFLAGFDYFTRINTGGSLPAASNAPAGSVATAPKTPDFWASFGRGNLNGNLSALDADPTNGYEVGDLLFALVGAGNNLNGSLYADDDIIALNGGPTLDGTPGLVPQNQDGDIIAGLSANLSISPLGLAGDFRGGNLNGDIIAGDDIYSGTFSAGGELPGGIFTVSETHTAQLSLPQTEDGNFVLTVPQFNAAQEAADRGADSATLTNVQITRLISTTNGRVDVDNTASAADATGDVTLLRSITMTVPGISPDLSISDNSGSASGVVVPAGGNAAFAFGAPSASQSDAVGVVPTSFAAYQGSGNVTFNLTVDSSVLFNLLGGGGGTTSITRVFPDYFAQITVTYTFNVQNPDIVLEGSLIRDPNDPFVVIAAQGNSANNNGNVNGNIISGVRNQIAGPDLFNGFGGFINNGAAEYEVDDDNADGVVDDESSNIWALIIAGDSVNGDIDAGDVGRIGDTGLAGGSFFGGVHAGAGADLNIFTVADNSPGGSINGTIRTETHLDVRDVTLSGGVVKKLGILSEDDINTIQVGFGILGGNLLGNVVAEGDIGTIEVWGNIGQASESSLIFAGGTLDELVAGNPSGYESVAGHDQSWNTSTFGTVYANVYIGGTGASYGPHIHLGQGFAPDAVLVAGLESGVAPDNAVIEQFGRYVTFDTGSDNTRMVLLMRGGNFGETGDPAAPGFGPDVWLYNSYVSETTDSGATVDLTVLGNGAAAGLNRVVAVDNLNSLHVIDGSVRQIVVDDDYNISADIGTILTSIFGGNSRSEAQALLSAAYPFATASLSSVKEIEYAVNNNKQLVWANEINVDYNIGEVGVSIGRGLNQQMSNYAIRVQGDLVGYVESVTGSIGNVVVGGRIYAASGYGYGDSSVSQNGSAFSADFYGRAGIGDIYVGRGSVVGKEDDYAIGIDNSDGTNTFWTLGSMGVLSVENNIDEATFEVSQNLGGLIARTGYIDLKIVGVDVHGSIGLIWASHSIDGRFTAETGDIGVDLDLTDRFSAVDGTWGVYSAIGDIDISATAGRDIGNIKAATGSVLGHLDTVYATANGAVVNVLFSAGGAGGAGGSGGDATGGAGGAGGDGGAGSIVFNFNGSGPIVLNVESSGLLRAGRNIGNIWAFNDIGGYRMEAGGNIGDLTAQLGTVGAGAPYNLNVASLLSGVLGDGLESLSGSAAVKLGNLYVAAVGNVGNITAGKSIGEDLPVSVRVNGIDVILNSGGVTVTSTQGAVGHLMAHTGNIGAANNPVVVRANGGVGIDDTTLLFTARPINGRAGIGNIYSFLGDIWIDAVTGGDLGVSGTTVIGGVAAPLGSINGSVRVGGDAGGFSAGVANNLQTLVLGRVGIYRNPAGGIATLSANTPLLITADGVTYNVLVSNASGETKYAVVGSQVVFDYITLTQTGSSNVGVQVQAGGDATNPLGNALVKRLTINGSASQIEVNGSVEDLNVSGFLRDGNVFITGRLEKGFVGRDIGVGGNADGNAFVADGMSIQIGQGFGSLTAGGRNFGLAQVRLTSGSYFSFANTLRTNTGQGDGFITVYLGSGDAIVTVNNGQIQKIEVLGTSASDLIVLTDPKSMESAANTNDARATARGANKTTDARLAAQAGLVNSGQDRAGKITNLIFEPAGVGSVSDTSAQGRNDTAFVGQITARRAGVTLNNVIVEGTLGEMILRANSSASNVTVAANAGRIFATQALNGVNVIGDAGVIDGGVRATGITVGGNADVIKATKVVSNVRVSGDVGSLTSGGQIQRAFIGGNAGNVTGVGLTTIQIVGDVGNLAARNTAKNVAVGGLINTLNFTRTGNDMSELIGKVLDDAYIGAADGKGAFVKQDGVLIRWPRNVARPAPGPADLLLAGGGSQSSGPSGALPNF